MKKPGILLIIAIAFFLNANAQTHFTPTGDFTNAMNLKVLIATVNDVGLEPGDEIAVFDGTLCVGTAVLTEDLGEEFDLKILSVNAGADDLGTPKQDGYRVGYTILYKIWDASEQTEINVVLSAYFDPQTGYSIPAPTFERDGGAFVSLESTFSFFQITVQTEDCVCNGGTGNASFTINAGGTPLTGNVYDVFYKEQSQGQISSLTKTLPAGLHTFIIEDANKSRKFLDIPIMEPEPISFQVEQSLLSCGFDSSSVIITSVSGGSGEYQQWEIARDTGFTQIEQTIPSVSDSSLNLKPGIYYIRLFDSNGCTGNYVDNQGIKKIIVNRLYINYDEPVCNGDMVEVSVVAEYDNDGHLISYTCNDGLNWQASPVFNVQSGKSYSFGYRDETFGCTKSVDSFIASPDPVVAENIFTVDATCYGAENGKIFFKKIRGGNGPDWNISVSGFDYKNDTVNLVFTGISDTNPILTGIPASSGNYIVLINDSKGCSSEAYSVEINQPSALNFQVQAYNSTGNSCSEGRITVQDISGGTPFSGMYEVWLNNKLIGTFQDYDSGNTLYPGSYLVTVTDSMGCSLTQSVTIGSDITPVTIACPADTSISSCLSEIEIDSLLNLWIEKTTVSLEGGCDPSVTVQINKGDLFCGGNAYVSWMMYDEGILRDSCEAVFTVESPDTLRYNFPADTLMQSCDILTNLDLKDAFEKWVINSQNDIERSISGGCNPSVEILTEFPEYPDLCVDWIKTVEWLVIDRCDTAILSAQFKLIAPENVTYIAPRDTVFTVCNFHKNYSAQDGFESWVNQLTVEIETSINGGCNPVVTNNAEQFRINDECGQQQIKVTWFITDKCFADSTSATFFLMAPDIIKFDSPVDTTLMSCAIQSENEIENLFNGWVEMQTYVIQSTISGGCEPVVIINQDSVLLNDKCNSWSKQVEWLVADKCDTISVKHNFNFIGSDEISFLPPTDTLINSCEFAGKEQIQQLFSQWVKQKESELKKSITGGCYPVVSGNAESVVIPDVCINWQVEVSWIIADKCDSVVTSAIFKMEAPDGECPQHFHKIWEGTFGQNHMNINIFDVRIDGFELSQGDEIGIFDGDICVGMGKISGPVSETELLSITVSNDDGTGNGFIIGNEIKYKIWDCSEGKEFEVPGVYCFSNMLEPVDCSPFEAGGTAFVSLDAYSTPFHFSKCWDGNGLDHMNFYIFSAEWDKLPLDFGDEIAIFDGEVCVGVGKINSQLSTSNLLSVTVSADDGSGCGFNSGNPVRYRFWDHSEGTELEPVKASYFDSQLNPVLPVTFQQGESTFVQLTGSTIICITLDLDEGWNLVSAPVTPETPDIKSIFQSLIDNKTLVKVQDESGASLENWGIFGGWQNYIGNMLVSAGYKTDMITSDTLMICGKQVEYPYPIILQSGWNIMGYPLLSGFDAQEVVQQLIDRKTLVKVQDEKGFSIENWGIFGGWQNYIGNFLPGEGYKVKVSAQDTLWIYENYTKSGAIQPELVAVTHFRQNYAGNGVDHMNINLVGLPINAIQAGDELAVFEGEACVGAVTLTQHNINNQSVQLTASAFDGQAAGGFTEGSRFILKLWSLATGAEYAINPEILSGSATFAKHETTVASLEKYTITGFDEMAVLEGTAVRCYPNPFSELVTIEINLQTESEVEVEVLNQLGQRVKILQTAKRLNSGTHRLTWNGRNANNGEVTPGIYHLRMEIDEKEFHKKIVYSK